MVVPPAEAPKLIRPVLTADHLRCTACAVSDHTSILSLGTIRILNALREKILHAYRSLASIASDHARSLLEPTPTEIAGAHLDLEGRRR